MTSNGTEYVFGRTPLDAAQELRKQFVHVSTVLPDDVERALEIMHTPVGRAACDVIAHALFGARQSVTLKRKNGERLAPHVQERISQAYARFGRSALRAIIALGFVAYQLELDVETGIIVPFMPDPATLEYRVCRNRVTGSSRLYAWRARYGWDVRVYIHVVDMPRDSGALTSAAASLLRDATLLTALYDTAIIVAGTVRAGTMFVHERDTDTAERHSQRVEVGVSTMADIFSDAAANAAANAAPNAGRTAAGLRTGTLSARDVALGAAGISEPEDTSRPDVNTTVLDTGAGVKHTLVRLRPNLNIVAPGAAAPLASIDEANARFTAALAAAIGLPASLFTAGTSGGSYGAHLDVVQEGVNDVVSRWAGMMTTMLQEVCDKSYASTDERRVIRALEERLMRVTANQSLMGMLVAESAVHMPVRSFAHTADEFAAQVMISDEEYDELLTQQRLMVDILYDTKRSVSMLYQLMKMGTIDLDVAHQLVMQSMRLDRDAVRAQANLTEVTAELAERRRRVVDGDADAPDQSTRKSKSKSKARSASPVTSDDGDDDNSRRARKRQRLA